MASVSTNKTTGERTLQFMLAGKRKSIWLGTMAKRDVTIWRLRVEEIVAAKMQNDRAPSDETSRWVAGLDVSLHRKLVKVGLAEIREVERKTGRVTIGDFLDSYVDKRNTVKSATITTYIHVRRCLIDYFGPGKPLADITAGDAEDFRRWLACPKNELSGTSLGQGLAENTVRRRCALARQFFRDAVKRRLITENPFSDMEEGLGVRANRDRDYFVTPAEAFKVLDACPDAQWRLLFALSRYGGLRCPSEHLALRWGDVDFERGRITVRSPKTERHPGKEVRQIPLFPELRTHLQEVLDDLLADFDPKLQRLSEQRVITRYRYRNNNLRSYLKRIILKAGLVPWPKLFQNLRATRETELAEQFPSHVVCSWIGHSQAVANKHYLQVTDDHFEAAAEPIETLHNPMQSVADTTGQEATEGRGRLAIVENVVTSSVFSAAVAGVA